MGVRKCPVPTSHSPSESKPRSPAVLGEFPCDGGSGFSQHQYLNNDDQMHVQMDADDRGMTEKSVSAPGPERSFVSRCSPASLCPCCGDIAAMSTSCM